MSGNTSDRRRGIRFALGWGILLAVPLAVAAGCGSNGGPGQQAGGAVGEAAGSVAGERSIKPPEAGQEVGGDVGRAAGEAVGAQADKSGKH
jgi:hypothetical protein